MPMGLVNQCPGLCQVASPSALLPRPFLINEVAESKKPISDFRFSNGVAWVVRRDTGVRARYGCRLVMPLTPCWMGRQWDPWLGNDRWGACSEMGTGVCAPCSALASSLGTLTVRVQRRLLPINVTCARAGYDDKYDDRTPCKQHNNARRGVHSTSLVCPRKGSVR